MNKKVLLCEHKRHTTRRVASARSVALSPDGLGVPHPVLDGGLPHPVFDGGYPIQSWRLAHPVLDGYPPPGSGMEYPPPTWTWDEIPPPNLVLGWGSTTWTWNGVPAPLSAGWGIPLSEM